MRLGSGNRHGSLWLLLLVIITVLSASNNVQMVRSEEATDVIVDATDGEDILAEEETAAFDGPVVETVDADEIAVDEEVEEAVEAAVETPVEEENSVEDGAAEEEEEVVVEEEEAVAVEEENTNAISEIADSAKSKVVEIVGQIKDISPQQKKKIAAGALGVWGAAAGAGWILNNIGGGDE